MEFSIFRVVQECLTNIHRHATFKVTADTYTQAVTPVKRGAQARVAKLIMADGSEPKAITPTLQ
jgi:signal transduction histidine kinase